MTEKYIIFKIGGTVLDSEEKLRVLISCLRPKIVPGKTLFVHGGGPAINYWLGRIGKKPEFSHGQRVTDDDTIKVVEMVLSGQVNKRVAAILLELGYSSMGISGRDSGIATARIEDVSLGHVGKVEKLDPSALVDLLEHGMVPVLSPVCQDDAGRVLNVNADFFAAELAVAMDCAELNLVTSTGAVLKDGNPIEKIVCDDIPGLISSGIITEGMIPKLQASARAIEGGVTAVNLLSYEGAAGTCIL